MKIHDLKPAPGSKTRRGDASAAASAARAARPPAAAARARARAATSSPRFEGGQTPLHRRTPKAKGFTNPFRVEYHVVNLDTLEAFDAGTEVDPGHAARARPGRQAGPGQGARPGRAHQGAHGPRARLLGRGGRAIEAAGGTTEVHPAPWGDRRPPARGNALTNR